MASEYIKKARSFITWLIPFFMAVFLLFGCGSAQLGQESPVPGGTAETAAEVVTGNSSANSVASEAADAKSQAVIETLEQIEQELADQDTILEIEEDGSYTSKEEVALYIHTYGKLPENFITKKEAEDLGWVSKEGNLWEVAPGMSIGGSRFGNYEGQLPDEKGRKWFECDINFDGTYRGAERIVYSNDGLIYYTGDHYETFEQLY